MINKNIFRAYDVRALYGTELTDEAAYAIGRAFAQYLQAKTIAIGRDNRESSPTLFREVARGIMDAGVNVIDLDIVSTPMVYFASTYLPVEGAISITASHNPKEYNGIKMCRNDAISIGLNNGLEKIKDIAIREDFNNAEQKGTIRIVDIRQAFYDKILSFVDIKNKKFTIVSDTANAVGAVELEIYRKLSNNITLHALYEKLDSNFPNHEANPQNHETLTELQNEVKIQNADIGIAYDGDADRIGVVDETGEIVNADILFAIIARELLERRSGSTLLYDLRSTKALPETIRNLGGIARECPVGGPKIKEQMRKENALAAAEISGHFIYQELSYSDSSTLTVILLLNVLAKTEKKLSELAKEIIKYHHTGEINLKVSNAENLFNLIKEKYSDGQLNTLDGIKITYDDWWFSVRISNTEPVVRLVIEADTLLLMKKKQEEIIYLIKQ